MSTKTEEKVESKIDDDFLSHFLKRLKEASDKTAKMVKETSDEVSKDLSRVGDKASASNKGTVDKFLKDLNLTEEERKKANEEDGKKAKERKTEMEKSLQ